MQLDFAAKELTVKLVYYGPALSGKTTNLQAIHWLASTMTCGKLMTLETENDRTLFFDMLPITVASASGLKVRLKLFTVPGQVMHNATRRLVLQGVDGVAFIADSQICETKANHESFVNMQDNLQDNGLDPRKLPIVVQFNKRDLTAIKTDEEIDQLAKNGREPVFKAVAIRGFGVMQTFRGLVRRSWYHLEETHELEQKFGISPRTFLKEMETKLRHNSMER